MTAKSHLLEELSLREPDMVKQMGRVAAACDATRGFLASRRNADGGITLTPAEAAKVLQLLELKAG